MKNLLSEAIKFAVIKHDGQYDKGGNAYILHVLAVHSFLNTTDAELQAIAILHDVIEDTDATYADLEAIGMTDRVIAGVKAMTKQRGQTAEEYMEAVCSNRDAMQVKLADLRHNSDIRRLKGVTEKDIRRIEKYHRMFLEISSRLGI